MSSRRLRGLLVAAALAIPLAAAPATATAAQAQRPAAPHTLRVIQMNLCNSGSAHCFTKKRDHYGNIGDDRIAKKTMAWAVKRVHSLATPPDVITLNEICGKDLTGLKKKLGYKGVTYRGDSFFPVRSKHGGALKCKSSRGSTRYGSAIITKAALPKPYATHRDYLKYDSQWPYVAERRTMGCRKMSGFTVCTTQLLNIAKHGGPDSRRQYTEAQCLQMIERAQKFAGRDPLIIAGDLNLKWSKKTPADQASLRRCLKASTRYVTRKSDGDVQHVITTMHVAKVAAKASPKWITDHPTLWVKATR